MVDRRSVMRWGAAGVLGLALPAGTAVLAGRRSGPAATPATGGPPVGAFTRPLPVPAVLRPVTTRPRSSGNYTARLQDRAAARRRARQLPARPLSAALTLAGEAGHLAAALVEWPGAPVRGLAHVLAAACLGILTAILYFGQSSVELMLGIGTTLAIPGLWLAGAVVGLSLYQDFPVLAAVAVSTVEAATAALLMTFKRGRT